jgi:hypothetical protein
MKKYHRGTQKVPPRDSNSVLDTTWLNALTTKLSTCDIRPVPMWTTVRPMWPMLGQCGLTQRQFGLPTLGHIGHPDMEAPLAYSSVGWIGLTWATLAYTRPMWPPPKSTPTKSHWQCLSQCGLPSLCHIDYFHYTKPHWQ